MMHKVRIQGWKAGREVQPISLMRLVQSHLGLSLTEAKAVLDEFAEHGEVTLEVAEESAAKRISAGVVALGAVCDVK